MKYNAGGNTPRTLDPTLTRKKGALSHPGSLMLAAVALIFFAYMFGYLPQLDTYYNSLVLSINGQRSTAMSIWNYAPIVGGGILGVILLAWLWGKASDAAKNSAKRSLVTGRSTISEAEFKEMAEKHGVTTKVAHHTYKLLHHDYTRAMKVSLRDDLRRDLHWKETHLLDVMGNLARHCDRKKNLKANAEGIRTVLDLLLYVESCPRHFLTQSDANRRAGKHVHPSKIRRAVSGVTRMLKPLHKRSEVIKAKEQIPVAAGAAPVAAKPVEKKPALSFIRPRKYPANIDAPK